MSQSRRFVFALFCCVLLNTSHAQVPEIVYLNFDGPGAPVNLAAPGVPLAFINQPLSYAAGQIGSSLDMNSGVLKGLGTFNLTTDWTIECWIKSDASGPTPMIPNWSDGIIYGGNFGIGVSQGYAEPRTVVFGLGLGSVTNSVLMGPIYNGWYHVAVTCDRSTQTLEGYLGGILKMSKITTSPLDLQLNGKLSFGYADGNLISTFDGNIDELRIWSQRRSAAEINANLLNSLQSLPEDLRFTGISAPLNAEGCDALGANETVAASILSYGTQTLAAGTSFTWTYSVDGGPSVTETAFLATALSFGDSLSYSFTTPADLSAPGIHNLTVTCVPNTLPAGVGTSHSFSVNSDAPGLIRSFPWVEDFPRKLPPFGIRPFELPRGWEAEVDGLPDPGYAQYDPGLVLSHTDVTIPFIDSAIRYLLYSNSSSFISRIKTPCILLDNLSNPQFAVWHSSYGIFQNTQVSIDVEDLDTGIISTDLATTPIPLGISGWLKTTCNLSAFLGQRIRVHLRTPLLPNPPNVNYYRHLYYDDISIIDLAVQGLGQAPQPDLAELEINYSFGGGHDRPRSGDAGPYFVQTRVGELINFRFSGEPNQWLSLFWGALNPASINYGAIGLCDVGTGFDTATGLPANIWIIANGFAPTQPIDFLFKTDINGDLFLTTVTPPLPFGSNGAFQALFNTTNGNWFALSNAVELMVR